jgi:hypothetical protein
MPQNHDILIKGSGYLANLVPRCLAASLFWSDVTFGRLLFYTRGVLKYDMTLLLVFYVICVCMCLFFHFKAENEVDALVLRAYESFGGHNSTRIVSQFGISKVQRYSAYTVTIVPFIVFRNYSAIHSPTVFHAIQSPIVFTCVCIYGSGLIVFEITSC